MRPHGTQSELEARRREAVALVHGGATAAKAAAEVGTTLRSVRRWLKAEREHGSEGLAARPTPGRPSKLSRKQQEKLRAMLLRGPKANRCRLPDWDTRELSSLIQSRFGAYYSPEESAHLVRKLTGKGVRELNWARPWWSPPKTGS